jgi:PEP-CTERM motif
MFRFGRTVMLGIPGWAASATFGGVLGLLAALAAPSSARADVTEVFNLFGEFDNSSTLSGTVTIDTTNGSATAIDATADSFTFNTITNQGPQFTEYVVRAGSAGNADQLYLAFGVGSLLGYGGSSLSPDTQINGAVFLKGGGANPSESSPVPEPSTWALMVVGFAAVGFFAVRRAGSETVAATT